MGRREGRGGCFVQTKYTIIQFSKKLIKTDQNSVHELQSSETFLCLLLEVID